MNGSITESRKNMIIVAAVVFCAILARVLGKLGYWSFTTGLIRTMLYISLYLGWGRYIRKRVMQPQVRRYLMTVAGLMVLWFIVRSCRYFFVTDPDIMRYLWYLYYLPMLFIPLLSVFIAMSLGKPENYRLPGWTRLLYIPTALLLLLVLTNDLHQLVFSFPAGQVWTDENRMLEFVYFIVFGWDIICAVAALVIIMAKCRLSQRKKYLPFVILLVSIVYAAIYAGGAQWMRVIGGDITAAQCLMFAGILESCIQCGLIPANTGYDLLFAAGNLKTQITDAENKVWLISANAPQLPSETIDRACNGTVNLDKNTRLKAKTIPGGHVLWLEDITAITVLLEELEKNREAIAESNTLAMENYQTKYKINVLREKNRLYDLLQEQTVQQINLLNQFLTQYHTEPDKEKRCYLLAKCAVIVAYIKRRGNLMFIGEKSETTDTAELALCMEESFDNLELLGVECAVDIPGSHRIVTRDAIRVYDFWEQAVEAALDDLRSVWLKARSFADTLLFHLEIECGADLAKLCSAADAGSYEDGVWHFTLRIGRECEKV